MNALDQRGNTAGFASSDEQSNENCPAQATWEYDPPEATYAEENGHPVLQTLPRTTSLTLPSFRVETMNVS